MAPPIFCGSALNAPVRQAISSGGPRIRAPSPATCAERRPFFGAHGIEIAFSREGRAGNRVIRMRRNIVSTVSSVSNVQAAPGSGFEQHYWVRPAPFARRVDFSPARPCVYPVRLQTMLTVLTQSRAFLSGNWDESYCSRLELLAVFRTELLLQRCSLDTTHYPVTYLASLMVRMPEAEALSSSGMPMVVTSSSS